MSGFGISPGQDVARAKAELPSPPDPSSNALYIDHRGMPDYLPISAGEVTEKVDEFHREVIGLRLTDMKELRDNAPGTDETLYDYLDRKFEGQAFVFDSEGRPEGVIFAQNQLYANLLVQDRAGEDYRQIL